MDTQQVTFCAHFSDIGYIAKAQITVVTGTGHTDQWGYVDRDETTVELLEVWNTDTEQFVMPAELYARENADLRRALFYAALDSLNYPSRTPIKMPA